MDDSGPRTKNRREHAVPLSDWAIAELKALKELANGSRFVLPGKKASKPANPKLISRGVKRLLGRFAYEGNRGVYTTRRSSDGPHDLEPAGRDSVRRRTRHQPQQGYSEETYDLWEYFEEKRAALERWELYLLGLMSEGKLAHSRQKQLGKRGQTRREQSVIEWAVNGLGCDRANPLGQFRTEPLALCEWR